MSLLEVDCAFRYPTGFELKICFQAGAEVTALVGPSGCGKTTTLHLIAGLLHPASGRISLAGRPLTDVSRRVFLAPERRNVGFVPQDFQLFPHLTVEQNLRYGWRRNPPGRYDVAHLVQVLELERVLDRWPSQLSGGQKQRVALGRALLRGPDLLLLDEPLSALDASLKTTVTEFLRKMLAEYPVPTLLVSHDSESVASLATRRVRVG